MKDVKNWYNESYSNLGFKAQRLYPNEELLRFMGRNYFKLEIQERNLIKFLEVGCGSCSNLWMIAKEGFDAYGIDLSEESLFLGEKMLSHWKTKANLSCQNMTNLNFENQFFDVVLDVFSAFCLEMNEFEKFISESSRILKSKGKLFLYTPSVRSEAFVNHFPSVKLDELTIDGIKRIDSPFYGNFYPVRFENLEHISSVLSKYGFEIVYHETVARSYNQEKETFEHLVIEAVKI